MYYKIYFHSVFTGLNTGLHIDDIRDILLICVLFWERVLNVSTHAPPGTLTLPTLSQKPCAQSVGTSSSWISILLPLKSESSYRQILCSMLSCR